MHRRYKKMIRKEREIKVIYILVLAIFAIFLAIPIIRLLLESFLGEAGAGISNYVEVLTGRGFLKALGNSVAVSVSSALIATILAFFMDYSIQYTNLPGKFKTVIRTLAVLPMLLPTIWIRYYLFLWKAGTADQAFRETGRYRPSGRRLSALFWGPWQPLWYSAFSSALQIMVSRLP